MRRKWKSAFLACVMASSMIIGAIPTMVYADENVGSNVEGYVEESSGSQTSGDVSDVQRDNKQESIDTTDTTDSSNSGTVDSETKQETESTEDDSWQNEVPADESTESTAEDETTETESTQADSDLAKAEETSWKDKLKDGVYISYSGHVQTYGDRPEVSDGQEFGTTGEGKRLEAFSIHKGSALENFTGDIVYRAHVQTYGTQDWKMNGEQIGTTGQGKRLEAIQMYLTGELAEYFDVYYCLHAQTFGWTKWVKGSSEDSGWCGTSGLSKRVEAVRICLVAKDGGRVLEDQHGAMVDYSYMTAASLGTIHYSGHQQTYGDIGPASAGDYLGVTGQSKRLEALSLILDQGAFSGSVKYRAHVQTYGWQDWVADGVLAGTTGQSKRLEAIQIQLEGDITKYYDIYYRVHAQTFGWLGWAKNGAKAGSEGLGKRLESLQIMLVAKGASAPGSTANAFINRQNKGVSKVLGISAASLVRYLESHENDSFYLGTRYVGYDWRSPNGDVSYNGVAGMNCTGFVWHVLKSVGAKPSSIPNMGGTPQSAGRWYSWLKAHSNQVPSYDFANKSDMLNSGILEKGDIIWIWNENDGGKGYSSTTHHVGIFWGNTSNEDRFWHSSPSGNNQISPITGLSNKVSYTVIKL